VFWRSLDFGGNLLHTNHKRRRQTFHAALQAILTNRNSRVEELHLSCCGLGPSTCRALAKGLRNRFQHYSGDRSSAHDTAIGISPPLRQRTPVSLDLSNNRDVGDSGAAALAAAIRMGRRDNNTTAPMFDTLDLSACDIGDVGMEALALALEDAVAPVMIRRLVLCHNRITDRGAIALGQALHRNVNGSELHIDLSNNPLVTDRGITTLLSAVEKGRISNLIVRSCSIQADGAELVGGTLRSMALSAHHRSGGTMEIDLSGNPIGILRSKTDKGNMYSAGAIKSKASATASAYVSHGLSFLKKGLGSVGVTSIPESDDDDDESSVLASGTVEESDRGKNLRCGFKSLANAFIGNEQDVHTVHAEVHAVKHVLIGLRRTFCDTAGADALAAMITAAKELYPGLNLKFELDLNPVVKDTMVNALYGHDDEILAEMADRHNEAMDIIRQAHERAVTAAKMLAARRQRPAVASSYASSQYDTYESDDYYDDSDESFGDVEDEADLDDRPARA
jgi:Leucine Rich repeat